MRVRVRFAKTGKLRFVSAIDLGRLWERALRKADLPIAYSEGFSPHPKVSFPDALPLGYASTGEYAELTFAAPVTTDGVRMGLDAAFPVGMAVLAAIEVPDGTPKLASFLKAGAWRIEFGADADPSVLAAAAADLLAADAVAVMRERKGVLTEVDARGPIHSADADGTTLLTIVHHVEPPLRPTEVRAALDVLCDRASRPRLPDPVLVTRLAQGDATEDGLVEALTGEVVSLRAADLEGQSP